MTAKKPITDAFHCHYQALLFSLPMKDPEFLDELYKHGLLLEEFKCKFESLIARKERASYFLDHVMKCGLPDSDNTKFIELLTIMKKCNRDIVSDLANEIENVCTMDDQCKFDEYVYLWLPKITLITSYVKYACKYTAFELNYI